MFLNESEENVKEAETSEEAFMNESNSRIKKMNSFFSSDNVLYKLPELYVRLRKLQNNALITKQITKLVSLTTKLQRVELKIVELSDVYI